MVNEQPGRDLSLRPNLDYQPIDSFLNKELPLVLYAYNATKYRLQARECGWQIVQSYSFRDDFIQSAAKYGYPILLNTTKRNFKTLATYPHGIWWELPEELRYWKPAEFNKLRSYSSVLAARHPEHPRYMYLPNHYNAKDIKHYLEYLDIIPASVYNHFAGQPYAWVSWKVEQIVKAIKDANYKIGSDYKKGEKLPVAVLALFEPSQFSSEITDHISPQGATHNFWQSLVAGARGIMLFSHGRFELSGRKLESVWNAYCNALQILKENDAELAKVLINGKSRDYSQDNITLKQFNYSNQQYVFLINSSRQTESQTTSLRLFSEKILFSSSIANSIEGDKITLAPLGILIVSLQ